MLDPVDSLNTLPFHFSIAYKIRAMQKVWSL